ncbi:MAG: glycosyl hydrolase family 17 [Bacteroidia bacterium]|nr:glycosyl hydrolase family 17 [Bacteroidia bacterium]
MSENQSATAKEVSAKDILGNPDYLAISYGGYRQNSRDIQPTLEELKEDMRILAAMGIKVLRTYNTHFDHASNVLKAIHELKQEDDSFEMYVMLGAWIDCKDAFTANPDHEGENFDENTAEIARAVSMVNQYPDIIKVIAVGNEAMVKWAASYFVQPGIILNWVNYLQELKAAGDLPKDLWITSSDNFASWGGGDEEYHVEDLEKLIAAVDFVSLHTYPMHDTHYNPDFWGVMEEETGLDDMEKIAAAMERAKDYAISQYQNTADYIKSLGIDKPIHIGETGWASYSNGQYGDEGSKATDEYKEALYYDLIREWTNDNGIACFYFEAFDENWKDAGNPGGSENYFGLITIDGKAKYALWDMVDEGVFEGLGRGGQAITKTYDGDKEALLEKVMEPPVMGMEAVH